MPSITEQEIELRRLHDYMQRQHLEAERQRQQMRNHDSDRLHEAKETIDNQERTIEQLSRRLGLMNEANTRLLCELHDHKCNNGETERLRSALEAAVAVMAVPDEVMSAEKKLAWCAMRAKETLNGKKPKATPSGGDVDGCSDPARNGEAVRAEDGRNAPDEQEDGGVSGGRRGGGWRNKGGALLRQLTRG